MKRLVFLFVLVMGVGATVVAQDTVYPKYVMRQLSSRAFYGRSAARGGDSLAARFLKREFQQLGVLPLGEDYYQRFTYSTHSMEGACRISVNGKVLRPYYDFRAYSFSADYHQALGETPVVRVPKETLVDSTALQRFLRKHGGEMATAVLYVDLSQLPQDEALRQQYVRAKRDLCRRNPYGSRVLLVGVEELFTPSFMHADKEYDYALVEVLAEKMPRRVRDINIDVSCRYVLQHRAVNVCGMVPGRSDSMVVFTAHYDHLGLMGDSVLFHGVHDNASGVGAVMELARQATLDTPRYTTVFLLFSGEEAGLHGSRYAAAHPVVDFSRVKLLVNIDMFCGGDEGLMVFNARAENTRPYVERLQRLNEVLQIAPKLELRENRPNSDHYPFRNLCPSLYVLTLGGPYGGYHSPDDRMEGCGLQNFINYLTFIYSLVL